MFQSKTGKAPLALLPRHSMFVDDCIILLSYSIAHSTLMNWYVLTEKLTTHHFAPLPKPAMHKGRFCVQ